MLFVFQCWFSNRRSKAKQERLAADTAGARPPPPPPQTDDAAARSPGAKAKEHVVRLLRELREKAPEQAQREQLDTLLGQAEARAQAERERLAQLAEPPAADEPEGGEAAASSVAKCEGQGDEVPAGPSAEALYRLGHEATSAAELPSTDTAAALPDPPPLERTVSFAEMLGAPVGGGGGEAMDEAVDRSIPRSKNAVVFGPLQRGPALEPVGVDEMGDFDDIDVATCGWAMEALATVWAEDYDQLDARLPSSR